MTFGITASRSSGATFSPDRTPGTHHRPILAMTYQIWEEIGLGFLVHNIRFR